MANFLAYLTPNFQKSRDFYFSWDAIFREKLPGVFKLPKIFLAILFYDFNGQVKIADLLFDPN